MPASVRNVTAIGGRARLCALVAVAVFMVCGATACSSTVPDSEVRGEVLTRGDESFGGPAPALAEFRAGERAVYGTGPSAP